MVEIKEFEGLRYPNPEEFCTKPYDVISDEEAEQLRKNPNSAIHIILPVGKGEEKYENARKEFERLKKKMIKDEPSIYLYKEGNEEFSHRGFIFCVSLMDYENGLVKKHEETREKPLQDRIRHIEATKANTGLVWTVFKKNEEIKKIMDDIMKEKPIYDFEKYGCRHILWKINDEDLINKIKDIFSTIHLYIADGHHRMAAAWHYWKKYNGEEARYVMVFAANDDEVRILPYNRVIRKIESDIMEELKKEFYVEEMKEMKEPKKHEIQMYYGGKWWSLFPKEVPEGIVESLDVSILQKKILEPILGIKDIRKDPNIFFIGGKISREEYEKLVDAEGNAAVFYLHPTSIEELEAVADAGLSMPPKSTWFDPKLLTGLVFHLLE